MCSLGRVPQGLSLAGFVVAGLSDCQISKRTRLPLSGLSLIQSHQEFTLNTPKLGCVRGGLCSHLGVVWCVLEGHRLGSQTDLGFTNASCVALGQSLHISGLPFPHPQSVPDSLESFQSYATLQPQGPSFFPSDASSYFLPQGLCTCCSFCLELSVLSNFSYFKFQL